MYIVAIPHKTDDCTFPLVQHGHMGFYAADGMTYLNSEVGAMRDAMLTELYVQFNKNTKDGATMIIKINAQSLAT